MATERAFIAMLDVERFDDVIFWATSAGKARYQAYQALRECGYELEFKDITIRRFPVADDHEAKDKGHGVAVGNLTDVNPAVMEMMQQAVFNGVSA